MKCSNCCATPGAGTSCGYRWRRILSTICTPTHLTEVPLAPVRTTRASVLLALPPRPTQKHSPIKVNKSYKMPLIQSLDDLIRT
jgi:hypothetical protein